MTEPNNDLIGQDNASLIDSGQDSTETEAYLFQLGEIYNLQIYSVTFCLVKLNLTN